ncbi:PhzF family phenazine biosynthesis protein [Thalassotalea piscium]|uniref:PhzF family phenazine biosynthesis protein n=1 Tax=Thalassotalea piscium TaxID=1230533 RepID=A0A7X0NIK0_9GAMM|nr:PhzF family phenazine biosynthesis protein [Thalassotalea piscium]MBB6544055.1 PhzF family phenazine biosynthesis protein [Thalassotalea piscium]
MKDQQKLSIYQVDAFANAVFKGNPAAVVPLEEWLPDEILQKIAQENNLSETAFFIQHDQSVELRWFTPAEEVDLCGHATLATAHVLFEHLAFSQEKISFITKSGELIVVKTSAGLSMNFPASMPKKCDPPQALIHGLNDTKAIALLADFDYFIVLESEQAVQSLQPDFTAWNKLDRRGVIVTARGTDTDFVSRCFYPTLNVEEDPVTGSAHCLLAPYWAKQLNKTTLIGKQCSSRSGEVHCQLLEDRVVLTGQCADYLKGEITF